MIISCPHCQTKYQVTYEAIGSAGRKVQCAHCSMAWQQAPLQAPASVPPDLVESDRLFDAMAEDALDELMASEETSVAAERAQARPSARSDKAPPREAEKTATGSAAPPSPADMAKQRAAFSRRQSQLASRLPLARLRRMARIAACFVLAAILLTAYFARVPLVERYPALAGLYEAVGLGVNVVGLDFVQLQSITAASGGTEVLTVSAQIVGLTSKPVAVPPVIVSLLDASGAAVYEWSVVPQVPDLMSGERATFETRLTSPPSQAVRVRLGFAGSSATPRDRTETTASAPAAATEHPAPPASPASGAPAHH